VQLGTTVVTREFEKVATVVFKAGGESQDPAMFCAWRWPWHLAADGGVHVLGESGQVMCRIPVDG